MKNKIFSVSLLLAFLLVFSACDEQPVVETPTQTTNSQTQQEDTQETPLPSQQSLPQETEKQNSQQTQSSVISSNSPASRPNEEKTNSKDDAIAVALAHAKVTQADVTRLQAEYDLDDKQPHYDVEFLLGKDKYEYEIDAKTNVILKAEKNDVDLLLDTNQITITKEEAKTIVFNHSNVTADTVRDFQMELDTENGVAVYEIEFEHQQFEYEYAVNAQNGELLRWHKSKED